MEAEPVDDEEPEHGANANVSYEQLTYLLDLGAESVTLDYKTECDLNATRDRVEIAKDIGAMQIRGGFIVIGVDDTGTPVPPGVPRDQQPLWDEAQLRPKVAKWLPEPFGLHTAVHTIDGTAIVIVRVGRNQRGMAVFKADGQYTGHGGKTTSVFRTGDVFARHGTSSERWHQADIDDVIETLVAARKERWRAELADDMAALGAAQTAQTLATGPIGSLSWKVDASTFESAILELFRANDDIALRSFILSAASDARALVEAQDWSELATLIARLTALAANAITYQRPKWFTAALEALGTVYRYGFDAQYGYDRSDISSPELWLLIVEHLLGLGAVAVRAKDWAAVRAIALQEPGGTQGLYRSWLRHGLTMASRANLLNDGGQSKSLLTLARDRVAANPSLSAGFANDDNDALTALCQFDLLAALATIAATGNVNDRDWYPNFARFFTSRSEPAVVELLVNPDMRAELFPLDNATLAEALRVLSRSAGNQGAAYHGWFDFESATVRKFLDQHPGSP